MATTRPEHRQPERITPAEFRALISGEHSVPHRILGAHSTCFEGTKGIIIRAFHPEATRAECILTRAAMRSAPIPFDASQYPGLFEAFLPDAAFPIRYRLRFSFADHTTSENFDPYCFMPTIGDHDLHFIGEGTHRRLWKTLGAHLHVEDGIPGVAFAVWAPNAARVSVVGDFCCWDGRIFPMRALGSSGIFELFIPELGAGILYKFEIKTKDGAILTKADPFARHAERPPGTASRVEHSTYAWKDSDWMAKRPHRNPYAEPLAAYETHLSSWARVPEKGNRPLGYREIAPKLVAHLERFHFTHLELMPVCEYPFDGSWGYQVSGYFAPTARFGNPDDLRALIDLCHQHGISVVLDWVPAHFPKDDFALRRFDGTCLFEHAEPTRGEHPDWGTLIFNYGRNEVRNFLIASALYWLQEFHFDGLRVDAVASMLYLDYSRKDDSWSPNRYGGRENLEAIEFLRQLNRVVATECPGCVMIAEESTAWPGVTADPEHGGLGFTFKWNMGWMHDTLQYLSRPPIFRHYHQRDLTFTMLYEYSEHFLMPLSHDEVVHGKASLLAKMPGDDWQRFASLRLLLTYQYTRPGKKLVFMGTELAPDFEWDYQNSLPWHLLEDPKRQEFQRFMEELGSLYTDLPCLWKADSDPSSFGWIDASDHRNAVISYERRWHESRILVVLNFKPDVHATYRIGVPEPGSYMEIFSSDSPEFGGSSFASTPTIESEPIPVHGWPNSLSLRVPPLAALILQKQGNSLRLPPSHSKLRALADRCGICSGYEDVDGCWHPTSDETRQALLGAMGINVKDEESAAKALDALERRENGRPIDPVRVIRRERSSPVRLQVRIPSEASSETIAWHIDFVEENRSHHEGNGTDFPISGELSIEVPGAQAAQPGYHRIRWRGTTESGLQFNAEQSLIIAPKRCVTPSEILGEKRVFGIMTNLYSVRSDTHWGFGDLSDLQTLVCLAGKSGANFVGINPLHAIENRGSHVSPYYPLSRLYRNLLYLDIEKIPEFAESADAQAMVHSAAFRKQLKTLQNASQIDYPKVLAQKQEALTLLFQTFLKRDEAGERKQHFRDYVRREGKSLLDFATFLALHEHFNRSTRRTANPANWAPGYEGPDTPEAVAFRNQHALEIDFYRYIQFELDRQLEAAADKASKSGLALGLIHDLALGSSPTGSDSWCFPSLFALGATIGAPPDALAPTGQNWNLAPLNPLRLREDGYHFWTDLLRHAFAHAGGLRIDHAMALERLFWIPEDPTIPGTYVRYPSGDLFGILALESRRAGAVVIAEDLGTVPSGFRETLEDWGLQRTQVAAFERDSAGEFLAPSQYAEHAFTTANTHDLPTLLGYLNHTDLELRAQHGLYSDKDVLESAVKERQETLTQLRACLVREGLLDDPDSRDSTKLGAAIIAMLAATPSSLVGIALDDLGMEQHAINLPGVPQRVHPSWSRRMRDSLPEILESPWSRALLNALRARRMHA